MPLKMSTPVQKLMSLKIGQQVLIETFTGELLVGTLKNINIKYLIVELDNVRDINTNFTYQSSQILVYKQMKNIKLMLNDNDDQIHSKSFTETTDSESTTDKLERSTSSQNVLVESSNSSNEQNSLNIQLSSLDLQLLQKQLEGMVFITQTDHKYHKALNDMKAQSVIGLVISPIEMGRHCRTSVIAVSTPQNIYIFDMLALGKIFKEVRLIFEAERPRKAVHFSHKIADHLKKRHNVSLKGIFDTFLAYCVVTGEKTNISFEDTIERTFNLSNIYFKANADSEIPLSIYERPMVQSQRMIIAKKVAFQLKLYDHLLHEFMLKNFYQQCEQFSQTFCNNDDDFEVGQQLHPNSRAGYEHIQPNSNWKEKLNFELEFPTN